MEKISIEEVKRLAALSALEFSDDELEAFRTEFSSILEMVDQVKNADLGSAEIKYHCHDLADLRPDKAAESFSQEEALANSPKTKKGSFCVPKMLEE